MPWHRLGTVSVTQNSTTVTGVNTGFAANTRVGDAFIGPDGRQYELGNVASDTVISILPPYIGPTVAGASYAITPVQGYQKGLSDQVRDWVNTYGPRMAALGTTGNYDILPLSKGGTGADSKAAAQASLSLVPMATPTDATVGRLLGVGGLGIGAPIVLSSPTVNNTITFGYYYINNGTGTPAGYSNGWLFVLPINADYVVQDFIAESDGSRHSRTKLAGTWRSWAPVVVGGANGTITSLSGLSTALSIAQGGTGATSGPTALTALGAMPTAGGAYNPVFNSIRVLTGASPNAQGGYIGWNETNGSNMSGAVSYTCNQGGGTGGFSWRTVNQGNTAGGPFMSYSYVGNLSVPGTISQGSDRRLKINDVEILDGLEKIMQVRPVEFDRRDLLDSDEYPHHEVGVIAQELYEVAPLLVTPAEPGLDGDIWRVNYTGLIPYLVSAVKTLKGQGDELKAQNERFNDQLEELKAQIEGLKSAAQ